MVLDARLMGVVVALLAVSSVGCLAQMPQATDQAVIENHSLTLRVVGKSCYLDAKLENTASSVKLKITSPCYFLRRGSTAPQSFSYKDAGIEHMILIIGSPVSKEKMAKWNVQSEQYCGESRQAVLIRSSGLNVSDKVLDGGVVCRNLGADEKDFRYFAH